jgi:hypothetical protein
MKGVLQFINDVAFEHITGEDDNQTVHPCSLKFTFREGRWESTSKAGKARCRRAVKCMTCEKALHVAQAMEALGCALQAFAAPECAACAEHMYCGTVNVPHTCDLVFDMGVAPDYESSDDPCDDTTEIGYAEALTY